VVLALLAAVAFTAPNRPSAGLAGRLEETRDGDNRCGRVSWQQSVFDGDILASWRDKPPPSPTCRMRARVWLGLGRLRMRRCWSRNGSVVLGRMVWPENLASHMFRLLRDRPNSTRPQRTPNAGPLGRVVDAKVTWIRTIVPGPNPQCGYLVQPDTAAALIL